MDAHRLSEEVRAIDANVVDANLGGIMDHAAGLAALNQYAADAARSEALIARHRLVSEHRAQEAAELATARIVEAQRSRAGRRGRWPRAPRLAI